MPRCNPGLASNDAHTRVNSGHFRCKSVSRSVGGGSLCSALMRTGASLTFAIPRHGVLWFVDPRVKLWVRRGLAGHRHQSR